MYRGQLTKWDSTKGFGFIKSPDLNNDTFIHISALKHMNRKPKQCDFIHFDIEQHKGKTRATNARIEGVKIALPIRIPKSYKPRSNNKLFYIVLIIGIIAFVFQRLNRSVNLEKLDNQLIPQPIVVITPQHFSCDGRQHCSQMNSRAEAEFFITYCPDTKMDGDHDGVPCENDSRF